MISFVNLLCVLLTYLIELWISPGCLYEFDALYVQREKSCYMLYYSNIWSTHFQEQKFKKIIKRHFCLSFSLLYLFICSCKFLIIETWWQGTWSECYNQCFITKTVLNNFAIFAGKRVKKIVNLKTKIKFTILIYIMFM